MKQDRDNERLSRRELLMALASVTTAGGAFVQFCMSDAGKRTVEIAGDAIPARFQTEYATKDVLALFPDFFAAPIHQQVTKSQCCTTPIM